MMFDDAFRKSGYKHSGVACQVVHLWESVENPILVCSLRVNHAITSACEEVDVLITCAGVTIRHRSFNPLLPSHKEITIRSAQSPEHLSSQLRSLGIFDLGSVEQTMYDGALAEIAAKELGATNVFSERSIDTPQARIRKVLLSLANEKECEAGLFSAVHAPILPDSERLS